MTISDDARAAAADLTISTGRAAEMHRGAILSGEWDEWTDIQAFARFEAQIVERCAAIAEAHQPKRYDDTDIVRHDIAAAIRSDNPHAGDAA